MTDRKKVFFIVSFMVIFPISGYCSASGWAVDPLGKTVGNDSLEASLRTTMAVFDRYTSDMNVDSMIAIFTENGEVSNGSRSSVSGRDAIKSFLNSFNNVIKVDSQQTEIKDISFKSDTAIVNGIFHQKAVLISTNKTIETSGEVKELWIRQADGKWQLRKMSTK